MWKMADKKARSPNFLPAEKETLLKIVTKYKGVIENKETDAVKTKVKNSCWEKIATEFNCTEGRVHRDAESLKSLWDNLKRSTRKHFAEVKKQVHLTGGGQVIISASGKNAQLFEHVKPLIEASVTGLPSPVDCDYIPVVDDAAYEQLLNENSLGTMEGSGEDAEVHFGAEQDVQNVSPEPYSEESNSLPMKGEAGPSTMHRVETKKMLRQQQLRSILNKGRVAKNSQNRMRNAKRAQTVVDLAKSKKELAELMKIKMLEKMDLEKQILLIQLEKEKIQLQLEREQARGLNLE